MPLGVILFSAKNDALGPVKSITASLGVFSHGFILEYCKPAMDLLATDPRASLSILFSDFILGRISATFVGACLECRRRVDAHAFLNQ